MGGWWELGGLAVGLAMDATAVAAGLGARDRGRILPAALLFGLFQAGMSGLGAVGGVGVARYAAAWDHWIAAGLLWGVGAKMFWETLGDGEEEERPAAGIGALLALALATSIDALAAGLALPMLGPPLLASTLVIGVVTLALSAAGGAAGERLGHRFGARLEQGGALFIVFLGFRILYEHLGA